MELKIEGGETMTEVKLVAIKHSRILPLPLRCITNAHTAPQTLTESLKQKSRITER